MSKSLNTNFIVNVPAPIDTRTSVATFNDLFTIAIKFNHLVTHVIDEDADYKYYSNTNTWIKITASSGGSWGTIAGNIDTQIDLKNKLDGYALINHTHIQQAPLNHTHNVSDINTVGGIIEWDAEHVAANFILIGSGPSNSNYDNSWVISDGINNNVVINNNIVTFEGFTLNVNTNTLTYNLIETDPTVPIWVKNITQNNINDWNMAFTQSNPITTSTLINDGDDTINPFVSALYVNSTVIGGGTF